MERKIQTKDKNQNWIDCEYKTFKEVQEDGWVLVGVDGSVAFMLRNGYFNEFREIGLYGG